MSATNVQRTKWLACGAIAAAVVAMAVMIFNSSRLVAGEGREMAEAANVEKNYPWHLALHSLHDARNLIEHGPDHGGMKANTLMSIDHAILDIEKGVVFAEEHKGH